MELLIIIKRIFIAQFEDREWIDQQIDNARTPTRTLNQNSISSKMSITKFHYNILKVLHFTSKNRMNLFNLFLVHKYSVHLNSLLSKIMKLGINLYLTHRNLLQEFKDGV